MATTLTAGNATNGLSLTPDNTGILELKTGTGAGTTAMTIGVGQAVALTGAASVAGNLSFNSGYGSSAVAYGCRAWVNFNGAGTIAIRASGNVSSITDGGVGLYTVNFTIAMPDVNYICVTDGYDIASGATAIKTQAYANTSTFPVTVSSQPILTSNAAGTALIDLDRMFVAFFR